MTAPIEQTLFERIRKFLPITGCFAAIEKACAEHEQRLAETEAKAKIVDAMKLYDESAADAEFEPPHPIFQICEERDSFMFKSRELEGRLAEAEAKLAQAQSVVAQKDLALAAANELLAETKTERDDLQKRMKGIRNVLGTITPSIAPLAVVLIAEAAMEITAPMPEKKV